MADSAHNKPGQPQGGAGQESKPSQAEGDRKSIEKDLDEKERENRVKRPAKA